MRFARYSAVVCIPVYVLSTFVAHLYAPMINPLHNWLSDYGNPLLNPAGAIWYNAGCIAAAVLLAVFYIGMRRWYADQMPEKKYVISYVGARVFGITGSVFLVLTSMFPLGTHTEVHKVLSPLHMIATDSFMVFLAIACFLNPKGRKAVGILAVLLTVFNIVTTNAFSDLYVAEWIYFLGFMVFMVLVTLDYGRLHEVAPTRRIAPTPHGQLGKRKAIMS